MRRGWIKYFADGTYCDGNDYSVTNGISSWTKSRNTDVIKAETEHDGLKVCILGHGEYWQSDDLISIFKFGPSPGILQVRRIMKKIDPTDRLIEISQSPTSLLARFVPQGQEPHPGTVVILEDRDVGKWLVLELSLGNSELKYYFSDVKI